MNAGVVLAGMALAALPASLLAQRVAAPTVRVGEVRAPIRLDGVLNEPDWSSAEAIEGLTMIEPVEGGALVGSTSVRVMASQGSLVIGIVCRDPDPTRIVSYSKARDSDLQGEDHVKIILDTFRDGRSGYIFAVNPAGARYDALVADFGEGESPEWDAVWEAATARGAEGWSVEIRLPIQSLSFRTGLTAWGFNVERRLDRLQEVSRWASPVRDAKISQSSRAGRLTGLPRFDTGVGLTVRPAVTAGLEKPELESGTTWTVEPSLDVFQRLGSNAVASLTVNTDFAETEVDTRRTNLTRFPLFFPEKRTFFLESADIFDFGIGMHAFHRPELLAFHSRRIGLYEDQEVPVVAGGKVTGRTGQTNFGTLAIRTGEVEGALPAATMGVARVKQNVLAESSVGMIATVGDPEGRADSWMAGVDATFQTSRLWGDKNFLIGAWILATDREDLSGDRTAFGAKVDYPNDAWDVALTYRKIGDGFDPSLGFVPRRAVHQLSGAVNHRLRPSWPWLRWMYFELRPSLALDLDGRWESYRVFTAPLNWQMESGERVEFNIAPEGERLVEPFEVADSVFIQPGSYHFVRYRIEGDIASKRMVNGRLTWWFGGFYDGSLHQIQARLLFKPSADFSLELAGERNIGRLPAGDFEQQLASARIQINFSPDLQWNAFVQYDNESDRIGANTRLRWTFHPLGEVFLVYNHNLLEQANTFRLESNQLLVKLQYALRM